MADKDEANVTSDLSREEILPEADGQGLAPTGELRLENARHSLAPLPESE